MAQLKKNLWQVKVILIIQKSSSGPRIVGGVWVPQVQKQVDFGVSQKPKQADLERGRAPEQAEFWVP